jgi:hypothetical protein
MNSSSKAQSLQLAINPGHFAHPVLLHECVSADL